MSERSFTWLWYRCYPLAFGGLIWLGLTAWLALGIGEIGKVHHMTVAMLAIVAAVPAMIVTVLVELLKRWISPRPLMIVGVLILVGLTTHGTLAGRQMARFQRRIISPPPQSMGGLETWHSWGFILQHEDYYLFTVNDEDFLAIQKEMGLEDITPAREDEESFRDFQDRFDKTISESRVRLERMQQGEVTWEDVNIYSRFNKWTVAVRNPKTGETLIRDGAILP